MTETTTSNKRTDIRVKRTYNQLTEALIRLLEKKSFDDLTVLEICTEANVHRATFYKHFIDKHDFLNCCFKMKLSELEFEKPNNFFSIQGINENCMKMISKVLVFLEDNKAFVSSVSSEYYSSSFTNSLLDSISEFIIAQISEKGSLSEKLGYNLPLMANYYSGAIVGLARWWAISKNTCSKRVFLDFAKRKVDDLCNYLESFMSGEES